MPLSERFLLYYHQGEPDACWPWTGTTDREGYGVIGDEKHRQMRAHRLAYERVHGQIPPNAYVLHRCDNPPCCNPSHLWLGTSAENNQDRHRKSRYAIGEAHRQAKLIDDDVREIRRWYALGTTSQQAIANHYGIHQTIVSDIVRRVGWSHVKD